MSLPSYSFNGHAGNRPIHCDVSLPYVDENGDVQLQATEEFCQFESMPLPGNSVAAENEGLWWGTLLWMLQLYPIWLNKSKSINRFTGSWEGESYGVIS